MGAIPAHADLVRAEGFRAVNRQPIADIATETLRTGGAYVATCRDLEPIVRQLVSRIRLFVESDVLKPSETGKLLSQCAGVVQKVGQASQGLLRASEGLTKLGLLLDVGTVTRKHPSELTQKELAGLLVETLKKLGENGPCLVCKAVPALDVVPETTTRTEVPHEPA